MLTIHNLYMLDLHKERASRLQAEAARGRLASLARRARARVAPPSPSAARCDMACSQV